MFSGEVLSLPVSYFALIKDIFCCLNAARKRQIVLLMVMSFLLALLELVSVGGISFMAASITDPVSMVNNIRAAPTFPFKDQLLLQGTSIVLVSVCLLSGMLLLVKNAASAGVVYFTALISAEIDSDLGIQFISNVFGKDYIWHVQQNSSDIFTAFTWRKHIGNGLVFMSIQTVTDLMVISLLLFMIVFVSPLITLSLLASLSFLVFVILRCYRPIVMRVSIRYKQLESVINKHCIQIFRASKDIKVFSKEEYFIAKMSGESVDFARCEGVHRLLARLPSLSFEAFGFLLVIAMTIAMIRHYDNSLSQALGIITFFTVAAWRIINALNRILSSVSAIRQDLVPGQKFMDLVSGELQGSQVQAAVDSRLSFTDVVSVKDISYSYPANNAKAVNGVSFEVPRGSSLGIIGRSGSGKSTLVDILIGLLEPTAGSIEIDGNPLDAVRRRSWMNNIGYVGQHPFILDASIEQNIAFGIDPRDIDHELLNECILMSNASEFVSCLSDGARTLVGESGSGLSGGQRQRISIARSLYRKPSVLILDEATSSLDIKSEKLFQNTISKLAGDITLIIVAHRLSTVEFCDKILWMENGKVVQYGEGAVVLDAFKSTFSA